MKKDFDYSKAKKINVEINGKNYSASYLLEKGIITVVSEYGCKSTQLGGLTEESLARILLKELISKE